MHRIFGIYPGVPSHQGYGKAMGNTVICRRISAWKPCPVEDKLGKDKSPEPVLYLSHGTQEGEKDNLPGIALRVYYSVYRHYKCFYTFLFN
jgi:hypothetical protein